MRAALCFFFALSGCGTVGGVYISELDRPLADLQKIAAQSLPLGLRKTSSNGREYFSHYFIAVERKFKPAESLPERRYAQILVLGDRRPYRIQIVVNVERKMAGGYSPVGLDDGLAKVVRKRVAQHLSKRREELNFIDDFRVF